MLEHAPLCCAVSGCLGDVDAPATAAPTEMSAPVVVLCGEHRTQFEADWLLLGWCDGGRHYAQAMLECPLHGQLVDPL